MKGDKLTIENVVQALRESYVCIAPEEGQSVYSYFNDVLSEERARRFEEHLLICFRCQDIIFALDLAEATDDNKSLQVSGGACD